LTGYFGFWCGPGFGFGREDGGGVLFGVSGRRGDGRGCAAS
jgi:hypothetical protein